MQDLVSGFRILKKESGDDVFCFGEQGDLFYIIIQGCVSVQIPNQVKIKSWKQQWNHYLRLKSFISDIKASYLKQQTIVNKEKERVRRNTILALKRTRTHYMKIAPEDISKTAGKSDGISEEDVGDFDS